MIAVHDGDVDRALVPIENSLEGSVTPTLDAIAFETDDVVMVGELRHPVHLHLVAAGPLELAEVRAVVSHPQASGQCARFLRESLPGVPVVAARSTADAVRQVAGGFESGAAAIGTRGAADRYGCVVAARGRRGRPRQRDPLRLDRPRGHRAGGAGRRAATRPRSCSGAPARRARAGSCAAWPSSRSASVNLTRIESRPRRQRLGEYMFFLDLEGADGRRGRCGRRRRARAHADVVRVLGSFPAA